MLSKAAIMLETLILHPPALPQLHLFFGGGLCVFNSILFHRLDFGVVKTLSGKIIYVKIPSFQNESISFFSFGQWRSQKEVENK